MSAAEGSEAAGAVASHARRSAVCKPLIAREELFALFGITLEGRRRSG
jgi:hypothetical protein